MYHLPTALAFLAAATLVWAQEAATTREAIDPLRAVAAVEAHACIMGGEQLRLVLLRRSADAFSGLGDWEPA